MAEKLYYSMGEVAEMLDVAPSLVRFWEKRFDIIAPHKNKKGNRLFSPEDVRNLKTIYHLVKEKGMTLAGAEKQLKVRRGAIERDMEIAERLGVIRALLLEVRNELGGGGTIVDSSAGEEAAIVEKVAGAAVAEVEAVAPHTPEPELQTPEPTLEVEPEWVAEFQTSEPESEPQPNAETQPETQQEPEHPSAPMFVEQTLF